MFQQLTNTNRKTIRNLAFLFVLSFAATERDSRKKLLLKITTKKERAAQMYEKVNKLTDAFAFM